VPSMLSSGLRKRKTVPVCQPLLATRKQKAENFLIQTARGGVIGIGERGLVGRLGNAEMLQLPSQPPAAQISRSERAAPTDKTASR